MYMYLDVCIIYIIISMYVSNYNIKTWKEMINTEFWIVVTSIQEEKWEIGLQRSTKEIHFLESERSQGDRTKY